MEAERSAHRPLARWWRASVVAFALAPALVACGPEGPGEQAGAKPVSKHASAAEPEPDPGRDSGIALVITDDGLAGVPVGTSTPRWVVDGAVAAPDGSAVFSSRALSAGDGSGVQVLRVDPGTGAEETVGQPLIGPAGLHVAAVEPGGGRVVLAAPDEEAGSTLIVDFDTATGAPHLEPVFEGTLEPEAYSLDRSLVFAARIYDDRYHVHGLDLAAAKQWPTFGPDKALEPEDMYGSVVQAALSPDGRQLATLYRDTVKPEHTGFVHLLSLESGLTVCIDLHEPFGSADPGREAIEWRADGTVAVGHRADDPGQSMTATFDPSSIWSGDPQPHYHADARPDPAPPALPDGVAETPGFRRFVAVATVRP